MSGLGGVWMEGGAGAIEVALQRMQPGLARRAEGAASCVRCGPVGMIHRDAADPSPPASSPRQPCKGRQGQLLAMDGRLDNLEELREQLQVGTQPMAPAELVLAGYERWGVEVVQHLLGDFALALWDPDAQSLLLARDGIGARPLFYHHGNRHDEGRVTAWASTLTAVVAAVGLPRQLDHGWLAAYFSLTPYRERTPYRNLRCVPPGCLVLITGDGAQLRRYWRPQPGQPVGLTDDDAFEERFRELFSRAVARRLDGDRVAIDLSGGLDSSSIAVVAGSLLGSDHCRARELLTVSFVYHDSLTADELPYVRLVERDLGAAALHIEQDEHPIFDRSEQPFYELPGMKVCLRAREEALVRGVRQWGARLQLRGVGGDHLLWSEVPAPIWLSGYLRRGRLGRLLRELRAWSRAQGRSYLPLLWQAALQPLLPLGMRAWSEGRRKRVPGWLRSEWVRRHCLYDRLELEAELSIEGEPPLLRAHLLEVESAINVASWAYDRGPEPLDVAYPYLDRELIELCLALPPDQLARPGEPRSIQRRALRELLPEEVARRQSKGSMVEPFMRAFARSWPRILELLDSPRLADLGVIEVQRLEQALKRARFGVSSEPLLMHVLGLELWIRSLEAQ